uniref:Uncharacterized protein n=1 Tax=Glossina pallidipes TaxID=7398 RepID=A0A1B0ACE8_GLOPL
MPDIYHSDWIFQITLTLTVSRLIALSQFLCQETQKRFGNNSPMLVQRTRYGGKSDLVTYKGKSFLANSIKNWRQTPHGVVNESSCKATTAQATKSRLPSLRLTYKIEPHKLELQISYLTAFAAAVRSAHIPAVKAAFSILHPVGLPKVENSLMLLSSLIPFTWHLDISCKCKKRFGNNSPMLVQRARYGGKSDLVTFKGKSFLANSIKNWGQTPYGVWSCYGVGARSSQTGQIAGFGNTQIISAKTSIPSQVVTGPIEKHNINEGQPRPQQQVGTSATTNEIKSRNIIELKRWHVKFDGSGKAFTAEGFIFCIERLSQPQ